MGGYIIHEDDLVGREVAKQKNAQREDDLVGREVAKQKNAQREEGPFGAPLSYGEGASMQLRDGQPCFLSDSFRDAYPHAQYPELEVKRNRPHVLYLVEVNKGQWFAIPLRSHIHHSFRFKTSSEGGLDYTKAIPILDPSFIDTGKKAYVRQDEWPKLKASRAAIKRGMQRYVERYKTAKMNPTRPGNALLIRYSTLQYFEDELGLNQRALS